MALGQADTGRPFSLRQADLYSAHFLVRKAQGGSRYLDWLHAILHKLEGDFRNAKMWYTDLGNNNAGALVGSNDGEPTKTRDKAEVFRSFHEFWFVSAANGGGGGDRVEATDLNVAEIHGRPRDVRLTAHEHTDLVFLCSVLSQAGSPSATNLERVKREVEIHHSSTTLAEAKIKDSQSAFSLDELYLLCDRLAQDGTVQGAVRDWTQLELLWMLDSMQNKFGWRKYDLAETMEAFRVESTPAHESMDEERKSKASNMVLDPGQGQRKF